MEDMARIRENFPVLEHTAYLDTATTGPFHKRVHAAATKGYDQRLEEGLSIPGYKEWARFIDGARDDIASVFNAKAEELAYTKNASEGINIATRLMNLSPGDNVVIPDISFPSNSYALLNLRKKGVQVKWARSTEGTVPFEEIMRQVDERTRAVFLCHVEHASGFRHDLDRIGAFCRERKLFFHVDCTQSIMALRLDVKASNIDMMSSAVYKWPCCPLGVGVFYCSARLLENAIPESVGWFGMEDRWDMPQPPIDIPMPGTARRFETGSPNYAGIFALAEAVRIYREMGPKVIEERVLRLNTILSERLLGAGIGVLGPFEDDNRSGILYARIPDLERVSASLTANKVRVNLGHGMARISTHYFNTEEDIDRLVAALR